ncbi:hypothetical protein HJC23_006057 [Cyclotella cryptica]|uniref:Uncharacterized protein n=1 Tax=Cyclotella cryptica TaxID=29204 RepID=A0ABD3PU47_9STRA|eukprot:CCRYP_011358-RA/>CCRYP_011358-RA protein AED:0.11 eAED:-0.14 QI:0/-1/0/1/-1/1/1/0/455
MNTLIDTDDHDILATITEEKSDSSSFDSFLNFVEGPSKLSSDSAAAPPDKTASLTPETTRLAAGRTVQFHGLGETSNLNGTTGTIEFFLEGTQQWRVRCHRDDQVVNASAENLKLLDEDRSEAKAAADKKKKKKKSKKDSYEDNSHALETSQQILIDLCNEMKSLKESITATTSAATSAMKDNLTSNTTLLHTLQDQMDLLRSNLHELDATIDSKATPAQIEEMGRIRAIQEILAATTQDKNKTIQLYETHARRGYEEIERLRGDLERERGENETLREELARIRGGGGGSSIIWGKGGPGAMYVSNDGKAPISTFHAPNTLKQIANNDGASLGTFDDMTMDTKLSSDNTVAYETKSLKKRIIHMKKKLQVAQLEAKEAGQLRSELESMRLKMEGMRKENDEKDRTIQRLKDEIARLKEGGGTASMAPSTSSQQHSSVTITTTSRRKSGNKWWQGL